MLVWAYCVVLVMSLANSSPAFSSSIAKVLPCSVRIDGDRFWQDFSQRFIIDILNWQLDVDFEHHVFRELVPRRAILGLGVVPGHVLEWPLKYSFRRVLHFAHADGAIVYAFDGASEVVVQSTLTANATTRFVMRVTPSAIATGHTGHVVAIATIDRDVRILTNVALPWSHTILPNSSVVSGLCFISDDKQLVTIDNHGWFKIWDVASSALLNAVPSPSGSCVLARSPSGRYVLVGTESGGVVTYDVSTRLFRAYDRRATSCVRSVAMSHDDRFIAVGHEDGRVETVDATSGTCLAYRGKGDWPVKSVAFVGWGGDVVYVGGFFRTVLPAARLNRPRRPPPDE